MRTTLAAILRRVGYTVALASDGEAAVEICMQHPFDLVVMDALMSGMDGKEAVRQIRRRQPQIHVIFMSAYGMDTTDHFFSKPLDIPGLLSEVGLLTQSSGVSRGV